MHNLPDYKGKKKCPVVSLDYSVDMETATELSKTITKLLKIDSYRLIF